MRGALLKLILLAIISAPQLGAQSTSAAEPLNCNEDTADWSGNENPGTTRAEQCAWARIRAGQVATFAKPELENPDGTWQEEPPQSRESRLLRGEFIKEILREKWSKQIPTEGIRISGAIIDNLMLDNVAIDERFECQYCDFEGGVRFLYVRPKWFIDLTGSNIIKLADQQCKGDERDFRGVLNFGGLTSEGSIILNNVKADCAITLDGAKIKENLILKGSDAPKLESKEAQIDGRVTIEQSHFINLNFEKAKIGRLAIADINDLYPDETKGAEVSLDGTSIDHDLELHGGLIKNVSASNMTVGGKVSIGDLRRKNKFGQIEVRPLACEGGLCVIEMPNSNVANVELRDDLPARFNVIGLTYKSFTLLKPKNGEAIDPNKDDQQRYLNWLYCSSEKSSAPGRCSHEEHSPQPYLQLANVFKIAGLDDEVDKIHIWEREAARVQAKWYSWPWETLKYGLIGYGYRKWLAFVWVGFFLVLGWIVVRRSPVARKRRFGFTYSFDMLLPIVRLREAHYKTELELPYRAYFYVHRIIGYLLGLFLLAALSGLTNVG